MKMFGRRTYRIIRFILLIAMRIWHPVVRVKGRENLPEGPAVVACNHSAFSDPIWIVVFADFPKLPRTMAKQELLKLPFLGWLYRRLGGFPVDRHGVDITAVKTAMKTIKDGNKLVIFPEGTRIRRGKKSEPHNGAVLVATRTGAPVVPVFLSTKKRPFSKVDLIIGHPYMPEYEGKRPTAEELNELSADLLTQIYRMGEGL